MSSDEIEYLDRIINGENLSKEELMELISCYMIEQIVIDKQSESETIQTIIELDEHYFAIEWEKTPDGEYTHFNSQPYEVEDDPYTPNGTGWKRVFDFHDFLNRMAQSKKRLRKLR